MDPEKSSYLETNNEPHPLFFLWICLTFYGHFWVYYYIWKCVLDPENVSKWHYHWTPSLKVSWFFCYFIAIFNVEKYWMPNREIHHGPWTCSPILLPTVGTISQIFYIFLPFYYYFSFEKACIGFLCGNICLFTQIASMMTSYTWTQILVFPCILFHAI